MSVVQNVSEKSTGNIAVAACARALARAADVPVRAAATDEGLSLASARGNADVNALYRAHHQPLIHEHHRPSECRAAAWYDVLEELRLESIGTRAYAGVAANLMHRWQTRHRQRSSAGAVLPAPQLDALRAVLVEHTSSTAAADVSSLDAELVQSLKAARSTPAVFSPLAAALAALLALDNRQAHEADAPMSTDDNAGAGNDTETTDSQSRADHDGVESDGEAASAADDTSTATLDETGEDSAQSREDDDAATAVAAESPGSHADAAGEPMAGDEAVWVVGQGPGSELNGQGRYRVYSCEHDETLSARDIGTEDEGRHYRFRLDRYLAGQSRVVQRLTQRLYRRLMARQRREWVFDQTEGLLDTSRLTRVITDSMSTLAFKSEADGPFRDTAVTLLIDNSRSMLGKPILVAAASADILARTLERCGVSVEVLGFTTISMDGGIARDQWQRAGSPAAPGRLNGLRHIIYKSADQPWRRSRQHLALMLKPELLNQNIDGEALSWAALRLRRRPETRKILMVISDGAPVDVSTLSSNDESYLAGHLQSVIERIEADPTVQLMAIGIGQDVTHFYRQSMSVINARDLGRAMITELAGLFERP